MNPPPMEDQEDFWAGLLTGILISAFIAATLLLVMVVGASLL